MANSTSVDGTLRQRIANKEQLTACLVFNFAVPGLGQMLKAGGCDIAILDMEHGGLTLEQIKWAIKDCIAGDVHVVVRPPSSKTSDISQVLDCGAEGVMVPLVRDIDDAMRIADAIKYAPDGKRGMIIRTHFDRFEDRAVDEALPIQNDRTVFWPLIETKEALEDIEKIAALDAVDAVFIGHFDLSASLGHPGDIPHPTVQAAIQRIETAAKDNGKPLAMLGRTQEDVATLAKKGFGIIALSTDAWLFIDAVKSMVDAVKGGKA